MPRKPSPFFEGLGAWASHDNETTRGRTVQLHKPSVYCTSRGLLNTKEGFESVTVQWYTAEENTLRRCIVMKPIIETQHIDIKIPIHRNGLGFRIPDSTLSASSRLWWYIALHPGDFGSKARSHSGPFEFVVFWQQVQTWLSFPFGTGHPIHSSCCISLDLATMMRPD